jgi:hypothetical protein
LLGSTKILATDAILLFALQAQRLSRLAVLAFRLPLPELTEARDCVLNESYGSQPRIQVRGLTFELRGRRQRGALDGKRSMGPKASALDGQCATLLVLPLQRGVRPRLRCVYSLP